MSKYLVTGGAGFIGSHVAEALLAQGDEMVLLDAFDPYYDVNRKRRNAAEVLEAGAGRATLLEGDVRDPKLVYPALDGVDGVVHLAARPGVRASVDDPQLTFDVNLMGTLNLLQALRARQEAGHGAPRLVFASSSSVYGGDAVAPFREDQPASRPLSPYAASKRAGEHLCASYVELFGFGVIVLRFFTVYGPRGRPDMAIGHFSRRALLGEPVTLFGDGSAVRDFTYVDDVVAGVVTALDQTTPGEFEVLNLGGGNTATMRELLALIERAAERPLRVERRAAAAGDMPLTQADLTRVEARLGWRAQVSLAEGVGRAVAWTRAQLEIEAAR